MPWPRRTCSPLPHQFGVEMAAPRSSKDIPPPPMWLLLLTPVSQQLKDIAVSSTVVEDWELCRVTHQQFVRPPIDA
ncbi:hypothetical protein BD408DRAFT_388176 [Parasitella parasitica]|nr:hypothetical protein BD408DRAFT_388176 [Parasitella parasitica]